MNRLGTVVVATLFILGLATAAYGQDSLSMSSPASGGTAFPIAIQVNAGQSLVFTIPGGAPTAEAANNYTHTFGEAVMTYFNGTTDVIIENLTSREYQDSFALAFGDGADLSCNPDGTNVDCTIANGVTTFGDGGTTNYMSLSATGESIYLGSATQTMNDNVELRFGTSAGQSEIASDATDTVWTQTLGVLRFDQVALDTDILQFESSDVAHGLTTTAVTSHYAQFSKATAAEGGLLVEVIGENAVTEGVLSFDVIGGQAGTTQDNTAVGLVDFLIEEHDGSNGRVLVTANGIGFSIRMNQGGSVRATHLFDEDGDITVDGSATVGTFSEEDDAAVAAALEHVFNPTSTTNRNWKIRGETYVRQDLFDMALITSMDPDKSMTVITKVMMLNVGGLAQMGVKLAQQDEYIAELEYRLAQIEATLLQRQ